MTDDNTADHLKTWQTYKQQGISGEFKMEHDIGAARLPRRDRPTPERRPVQQPTDERPDRPGAVTPPME